MSRPRRIVPGTTYLLTRRVLGRQYLLRPSAKINQICKYCLAYAAERTAMDLHQHIFLSNHYHTSVTDRFGNLPDFMRLANKNIAKCVNVELGREETFWSPGSYNAVELVEPEDIEGGLVYGFNNAVSSKLVERMKDWPGAHSRPADMEKPPEIITRPTGFFRENGPMPETVALQLCVPRNLGMSVAELEQRVAENEQELRDKAKAANRAFLGPRRVLRQSPYGRPKTKEERRGIKPRVAAINKWARIEALQRLKIFWSAYREAWQRYAAGETGVVFPFGTYGMRVRFGVMCNGP